MDLTPRLLTEVEFREQWRGYSPNDVDDFLERVAAAVGELQERLRETTERATQAERRLLERSDDDEIRRTLVLAQRTAVTAVEEARAEAERILAQANEQAREQVAEAEVRLANLEDDIAERTRVELGELADRRAALQADIDSLAAFREEHRTRLRAELQRQLAEFEEPGVEAVDDALAVPASPELTDVDLSVPEPAVAIEIEPVPDVEPIAEPEAPAEAFVPRPPTDEEVAQAREDLVEALRRAGVDEFLANTPAEEAAVWQPEPEPEAAAPQFYDAADESGEIDLSSPVSSEPAADDPVLWRESAPTAGDEPAPVAITAEEEDDPFLAELRRAVTDTEPLGPRDHQDLPGPSDDHDDAVPSGRFRLRRGR